MADGVRALEGDAPGRHLVGLEHRFKPRARVEARIAEDIRVKGRTVDEGFAVLGDSIRYTFQYPEDRYTEGVRADLRRLAAQGFTEIRRQNTWSWPEHKGIVSCWREPKSRVLFEVRFHTRPSYEACQLTHPAYERLRSPGTSDAERADLLAFVRTVYAVFDPSARAGAPTAGRAAAARHVTHYAIVDSLSSRETPAGVLRRVEHTGGQRDEAFGYDLAWRHTFLLYSAERGNLDNTLHKISENEAARIEARIRQSPQSAADIPGVKHA